MSTKTALVAATAIAIALTSFDFRPAVAAPQGGPAIVKQGTSADEISAQRKRRRGVHPGVPLAAFGMLAGTIAGIAAANNARAYYDDYHYAPRYYVPYDEAPVYGHYGPPAYQYYAPPPRAHYGYHPGAGYGGGGQQGSTTITLPSAAGAN